MSIRLFFFFNDPATPEIYTLPLHDALPILAEVGVLQRAGPVAVGAGGLLEPRDRQHGRGEQQAHPQRGPEQRDRKSTRLNSSHANISYAVFCLKKKKNTYTTSKIHLVCIS